MRFLACIALLSALSGCGFVYKIDVQQGNYVPEDVAAKVQVGMTKPQVRALLGTPLLNDIFHANRWDYFFSSVKGGKPADRTRFSIFFENDKVVRFEGKARPALPPPVAATPATPAARDAAAAAGAKPPAAANPAGSANSPVTAPGTPTPTSPPKQ
jgi:outer membrane protein assembly factor BamE